MLPILQRWLVLVVLSLATVAHAEDARVDLLDGAISARIVWLETVEIYEEDTLTFRNQTYGLCAQTPLTSYLQMEGWVEPDVEPSTRRGYSGSWRVENGALYLTEFIAIDASLKAYMKELLNTAHQRFLAYWFSGTLTVRHDGQPLYGWQHHRECDRQQSHPGWQLSFEHGLLKSARRIAPQSVPERARK